MKLFENQLIKRFFYQNWTELFENQLIKRFFYQNWTENLCVSQGSSHCTTAYCKVITKTIKKTVCCSQLIRGNGIRPSLQDTKGLLTLTPPNFTYSRLQSAQKKIVLNSKTQIRYLF